MIKLTGISKVKNIYVESDFYVPINISFEPCDNAIESRHCWGISRLDGKFLFEIAIGEETGELKYITLVASPKVHLGVPIQKINLLKEEVLGLPCFETKEWGGNDYYTKDMTDFDIYIDGKNIFIVLIKHEIAKIVINDRVVFGFDKNHILCSIEIRNMSSDERATLEESLSATGSL
jgi:hypothetical protein